MQETLNAILQQNRLGEPMVAVGLSEAKKILEGFTTKRGKVTNDIQSDKRVDAVFLSQTDSRDLGKALHLRYEGGDLVVERVDLIDNRTGKVSLITPSWEKDFLLSRDYKEMRRALGL